MNIVLLRNQSRALILPAGKTLLGCPPVVRFWLGEPYSECVTELTSDTPMPGIYPPLVLAEVLQKGYCALDIYGVVRAFKEAPMVEASAHGVLDFLRREGP
jgi:hypothetical protein